MIEVVLDTNIYSSDSLRRTARFNALVRLAKSGKLRLHIPYIVQKEFLSQQTEQFEQWVNSINNGIVELQRRTSPTLVKKLDEVKESFSIIQDDLVSYPALDFSKWINEIGGIVHPVSEIHGAKVIEDYFEGVPPFKNKKSRQDIPDSFIWQVVSDLANQFEILYVVANDKKVREACDTRQNIKTFETLDDFIQSDVCRLLLEEENVKQNIERLFKYIHVVFTIRQDEIKDRLTEILEDTKIQSERLIANNSHSAKVKNVEDFVGDVAINNLASAQYYGDGVIVVPFNAQVRITAEYDLTPTEYHHLSVKRAERISFSDVDEMAQESFTLSVTGKVSIKVDPLRILETNLSEEDIKVLADGSEFDVDSIEQKELIDYDPIQNRWEYQFLELVRFKEEHGHCEVPRKHPLGYWVSNQRQRKRIGALAKDRIERLDKVGFVWFVRPHGALDEYIDQLLEYREIYGHVDVPQQDKKYRQLGRWVNDQRTKKKRGTLSKEYENRLNEIGFVWNALEERWNQRLNELKEFHKKFGHFDVPPQITEFPKLYSWTVKLRRKRPTPDRLAKLKSIGYNWDKESRKVKAEEAAWDEKLLSLKEYYEANGHFDVNYKENKTLYNWLHKLRSRKPSEERLAKLRSIGFHWEPKTDSRQKPLTWEDNFNMLKAHFEANGTFEISSTKQKRLYNWLYKLKRNRPTDEQIEKLKSIGFDWEKEKVE